jgi:outer membrane autotransporter protein
LIDVIQGSTNASSITVAGRAGYLVHTGPLRAGPIAGLSYIHAVIQGYTETGDSLLTMAIDRQSLHNVIGDTGLQVRFPIPLGKGLYSPFVNVTAEHEFIGSGRTVTTTQVTAPLLPVLTAVPGSGRTYGRVAAGLAATVSGRLSATITVGATFARDGGNDAAVGGGFRISF